MPSPHRRSFPAEALLSLFVLTLAVVLTSPAAAQDRPGDPVGEPLRITLDDALATALEGSRELVRARWTLEEASGQVSEAWGNVYPRVDLNARYSRNLTPAATFLPAIIFDPTASPGDLLRVQFGADNVWSGTLSLEQPIFEARAFIGVGAADRFRALQEESVRGTTHQVVTRVRILYYDLLLAQEQRSLIERSVERVRQSLEETRALARAGLVSDYDVLRLEVELANLEPRLRRAWNDARAREREMVTEIGLPQGTRLEVAGALAEMDLTEPDANDPVNRALLLRWGVAAPDPDDASAVERLYERALVSSSGLQQLALNEELRRAELRVEQAEYLPRVSLFGSYDVQAQQDGSPEFFGASGTRGYGRVLGLQLSVPVFTGMQRRARVDQKRAAVRSVQADRDLARDRLQDELRSLLEQVEEAVYSARAQRLAVTQARRGFEIASAQYREGLGSQLELTDAEVALRESEFQYAAAVHDYLSSRARLDELVGEVPFPARGRAGG